MDKVTNTLSERIQQENKELMKAHCEASISKVNEDVKKRWKIDLAESKDGKPTFDFNSQLFSWKGFRESVERLHEANSETAFGQLLRAGVNNIANNWYQFVPTVHEKICTMTVSNKAVELYAPLHRGETPRKVERGEEFPETKVVGIDRQIINQKFGALFSVERELIDDDQTGQILQRARDIGENMKLVESAYAAARFIGAASSYAGQTISASSLSTIWSATLTAGTGTTSNRLGTYAAFSLPNIQQLDIQLMDMLDLSGNHVMVSPDTLYVGTSLKFPAMQMMNSSWYPSVNAMTVSGTSVSTDIGQMGAYNVMQGAYNVVVDRFLPKKAYALGQSGRGPVFQRRDPLEVIQENPMSGPAFSSDVFRFKARSRWEVDHIEAPRFWALGNDGSI
jgi:hypothetical protein